MTIGDQVRASNNVALYNCAFINTIPNTPINTCGGYINVGNFTDSFINRDLVLREPDRYNLGLVEECEVTLKFDTDGWQFFNTLAVFNNTDFEIVGDKKVRLINNDIRIENITYPPYVNFPILVEFEFIGSKSTQQTQFQYDIVEGFADSLGNMSYAGIHYFLDKPDMYFEAITDPLVASKKKI